MFIHLLSSTTAIAAAVLLLPQPFLPRVFICFSGTLRTPREEEDAHNDGRLPHSSRASTTRGRIALATFTYMTPSRPFLNR